MITTMLGALIGLLFGSVFAAAPGGAIGAILGMSLGMLWAGSKNAVFRIPQGAATVDDEQHLLCEVKGRVATASFVRDAATGAWLDVSRCSLCSPDDSVTCAKRCLVMIRGVLPARRNPVRQPRT
ncbi:MAG: hypothetical protein Fur0037_21650 [Planctomycetota bacterium]